MILETVRRSKRNRIKPLEYWKNETVEMKRFSSGVGSLLPIPVNIHHSEQVTSSQHSSNKRASQKKSVDDKERVRKEEDVEKKQEEETVRQEEEDKEEGRSQEGETMSQKEEDKGETMSQKEEDKGETTRQEETQPEQLLPTFLDNTDIQAIPTVDDSLILPSHPLSTQSVFYLLSYLINRMK